MNSVEKVKALCKKHGTTMHKVEMDLGFANGYIGGLRKYHQNNIRQFRFCLNRNTDADIIAYLESLPNIQGYLRELVKKDMNK